MKFRCKLKKKELDKCNNIFVRIICKVNNLIQNLHCKFDTKFASLQKLKQVDNFKGFHESIYR